MDLDGGAPGAQVVTQWVAGMGRRAADSPQPALGGALFAHHGGCATGDVCGLVAVHVARRGTGTFFPADNYAMVGENAERVGNPREK
jgi:hypothetical protein